MKNTKTVAVVAPNASINKITPSWMLTPTRSIEWPGTQDLELSECDVVKGSTSKKSGFKSCILFHKQSGKTLNFNMNELVGECEALFPTLLDLLVTKSDDGLYTWLGNVRIGLNEGKPNFAALTV